MVLATIFLNCGGFWWSVKGSVEASCEGGLLWLVLGWLVVVAVTGSWAVSGHWRCSSLDSGDGCRGWLMVVVGCWWSL